MNWKTWLYSLVYSVVGGSANSAAAMLVAPETFNFNDLPRLGKLLGAGAIVSLILYLKQSPLPKQEAENGRLPIALLALCLSLGSGCVLYGKRAPGELVSFTQSFVGIDVSQDPASQVPHFRIGFGRNQGHIIPTSTNVLYSPAVDSSIAVDSKVSSHAIAEDFRTGNATTNAQPAIRATSGTVAGRALKP